MITILLPAFNAQDDICRAIDSVLAQTYERFKLLVLNDGSTDKTAELVANYQDTRIELINMPENVGLINVLNHGLELAYQDTNCEYIARMDADDICIPTRLEEQIKFLELNRDYVACGTAIINFNDKNQSYMRYPLTHEEIKVALYSFERNICHPTVMMRAKPLRETNLQYRKDYIYAEDYVLWFDLLKLGKLKNLKQPLLKYQRHDDQVSAKYYPEQMEVSRQIVVQAVKHLSASHIDVENMTEEMRHAQEKRIKHIMLLCVHEQGVYPSEHITLKEIDETIDVILTHAARKGNFDIKALTRFLYFKKFRCTFYYQYYPNYLSKLYCFCQYLAVEPKRALTELSAMLRIFMLQRLKC